MKLQLDTKEKTIKLEESANLAEFVEMVKMLLPDGLWKEYSIRIDSTISYTPSIPIVIEPYRPYTWPWITYTNDTEIITTPGTYTIECSCQNIDA